MTANTPKYADATEASRIYMLPNLMTAGNLFCGFMSLRRCIEAKFVSVQELAGETLSSTDPILKGVQTSGALYEQAVWFILGAVVFDILDGRLARLGGQESLFGKEFDSIADVVSFGVAPAIMVFFLILSPTEGYPFFRHIGYLIGFIYLLCGAVRLARFNVITHPAIIDKAAWDTKNFRGLPIPAAAGTVASMVLVINSYDLASLSLFLPILMLLIAFLMVSDIPYPTLKYIDWQTKLRVRYFLYFFIGVVIAYHFRWFAVALIFIGYIFYGLSRHLHRNYQAARRRRLRSQKQGTSATDDTGAD